MDKKTLKLIESERKKQRKADTRACILNLETAYYRDIKRLEEQNNNDDYILSYLYDILANSTNVIEIEQARNDLYEYTHIVLMS